jgi:hypothetical protein
VNAIRDQIEQIVRWGLSPRLKAAGYQKSGRSFRLAAPRAIKVTNLEASWTNVASEGKFTVNVAVYFPEAVDLQGVHQVTDRPTVKDCVVQQRIGLLLPVRTDHWWEVDDSTDLDSLALEVGLAWEEAGKPWLDEHAHFASARAFMVNERQAPWWGAIFSLLLDEADAARSYLKQAINDAGRPDLETHLRNWGTKHGLA